MDPQSSGAMPRCYMVKKGEPRDDSDPQPYSPTEATVAPPSYSPPDEHSAIQEPPNNAEAAADYAELRNTLVLERSAADTEAAHELLSLAAGVPPLPPATMITMLQPPEPVLPVYNYTLQPATIYILSDEQAEPMYHAVQTVPLQQIEYTSMDQPVVNYISYPDNLPPLPRLQHFPPRQPEDLSDDPGTLTTISIEEITDSDTEQLYEVPEMLPMPRPILELVEPPPIVEFVDPNDESLCKVNIKAQNRFSCLECGRTYATSSNLSRHKQTHRSLDSNAAKKCEECGKAYVSMPALAMHVLTHQMGHVCGVCGKLFSRPWLLHGHLRSHTGEKPYNCEVCAKAFGDRSNLRAHMQTHSSDKKYECTRCNRSFALRSYLNKHQEAACTREDETGGSA